jgi:hypothetical protein
MVRRCRVRTVVSALRAPRDARTERTRISSARSLRSASAWGRHAPEPARRSGRDPRGANDLHAVLGGARLMAAMSGGSVTGGGITTASAGCAKERTNSAKPPGSATSRNRAVSDETTNVCGIPRGPYTNEPGGASITSPPTQKVRSPSRHPAERRARAGSVHPRRTPSENGASRGVAVPAGGSWVTLGGSGWGGGCLAGLPEHGREPCRREDREVVA